MQAFRQTLYIVHNTRMAPRPDQKPKHAIKDEQLTDATPVYLLYQWLKSKLSEDACGV